MDGGSVAVASGSTPPAESLRRGTRNRQPTRKAEALVVEAHEARRARSASREGARRSVSRALEVQEQKASHASKEEVSSDEEGEEDEDGLTGDERYCICRGKDNGSPMVWCGGCDEW